MSKKFVHVLSEILVAHHLFSESQVEAMEQSFARSSIAEFDEFVLSEGLATKDLVLEALSSYYKVPFFDVEGYFFDTALLRAFPKDVLLRHATIPVDVDSDILRMITDNPHRNGLASEMMRFTSYEILFHVGIRHHICNAIKEFYDRSDTELVPDDEERVHNL